MRTMVVAAVALAAWSVGALPASAQSGPETARYVAANCANCHGTTGMAKGAMPALAGLSKERIAENMRAFRDGKRPATVMHQIAKGYSEAQIDAIAAHFASQKAR